ncbi:hypothetical protein Pelo_6139 [Pelomyxa schiedti]|nr:hypothetical protein Pelo_6139 [Pelomyxa schiedti]
MSRDFWKQAVEKTTTSHGRKHTPLSPEEHNNVSQAKSRSIGFWRKKVEQFLSPSHGSSGTFTPVSTTPPSSPTSTTTTKTAVDTPPTPMHSTPASSSTASASTAPPISTPSTPLRTSPTPPAMPSPNATGNASGPTTSTTASTTTTSTSSQVSPPLLPSAASCDIRSSPIRPLSPPSTPPSASLPISRLPSSIPPPMPPPSSTTSSTTASVSPPPESPKGATGSLKSSDKAVSKFSESAARIPATSPPPTQTSSLRLTRNNLTPSTHLPLTVLHSSTPTPSPTTPRPPRNWRVSTNEVFHRPLGSTTVAVDLPRLCKHVSLFDCRATPSTQLPVMDEQPIDDRARPTPINVQQFLGTVALLLEGSDCYDTLNENFGKYIIYTTDIGVQRDGINQLLGGVLGASKVTKILKAINQSVIAPAVIELNISICAGCPFKDAPAPGVWEIELALYDDLVQVIHRRKQVNIDARKEEDAFEFTWELVMQLDSEVDSIQDCSIRIVDWKFGSKTSEIRKQLVTRLLSTHQKSNPTPTKDSTNTPGPNDGHRRRLSLVSPPPIPAIHSSTATSTLESPDS